MMKITQFEKLSINELIAFPDSNVDFPGRRTLFITEWSPTVTADGGVTVVIKAHILGKEKPEPTP